MGKFDSLKKGFDNAGSVLVRKAGELQEKAKNVNIETIRESAEDSVHAVKQAAVNMEDTIKNANAESMKAGAANMIGNAALKLKKFADNSSETRKKVDEVLSESKNNDLMTVEDTLKIIYLLTAADGNISGEEEKSFLEMAAEMDPAGTIDHEEIRSTCRTVLESGDCEDYEELIMDALRDAVRHSQTEQTGTITVRNLVWNMLTIAYCDGSYSEAEHKVMNALLRLTGEEKTILAEMEASYDSLKAVEEEITWLKDSDRKYAVIEENLNELADRKQKIMQGIETLITE